MARREVVGHKEAGNYTQAVGGGGGWSAAGGWGWAVAPTKAVERRNRVGGICSVSQLSGISIHY